MIEQRCIDEILNRTNIVDVVGSRVDIKKSGKNYHARCPFHDEKTPSFTVAEHKQFYYCFGCGAQGNAIGFLMSYDGLSFVESVKSLAANCGVQIDDNHHKRTAPKAIIEQYKDEKVIIMIYEADKKAGKYVTLQDSRRHRLAVARVDGLKSKYGDLV